MLLDFTLQHSTERALQIRYFICFKQKNTR